MDLNSPFFDRIRIRPSCDEPREAAEPVCDKISCRAGGRPPRAQGPRTRGAVLALLPRACARVQRLLQLFRRHVGRCRRGLPEGRRHRPPPDLARWGSTPRRKAPRMPRPLRATGPMSIRSASCAAKGSRRRKRAAAEADRSAALQRRRPAGAGHPRPRRERERQGDQGAIQVPGEAVPPRRPWRRPLVRGAAPGHHPGPRHAQGRGPLLRPTVPSVAEPFGRTVLRATGVVTPAKLRWA